MRISDWSSDVCPSDLLQCNAFGKGTSANAGGIECVDNPQHRLHLIERDIEAIGGRSEEHTSELQSLMRISYAVFCLKKKKHKKNTYNTKHLLRTQRLRNNYNTLQHTLQQMTRNKH